MAKIGEAIGKDIIAAMKAKEADKLTTLRMVKSAFRSKEIDKREPLTDAEEQGIITTLLKQRRESIESFTKGGRLELAAKEQTEIVLEDPHHVSRQRPVWPPAKVCDVHSNPPARLELAGALGEHIAQEVEVLEVGGRDAPLP